jgi:hypothetical protein
MQKTKAISPHVVEHRRSLTMHHVVLQSFSLYYSENRASEVDGNVARARRWSEKFQHNRVSKRMVKKNEGEGFLLYL